MRNLKKNQRKMYYSSYLGDTPILDEYGNETLEVEPKYAEPKLLSINYSPSIGEITTETFGTITNYSRVLSYTGRQCPLKEKDLLWIGSEKANGSIMGIAILGQMILNKEIEPNYEVLKIADSINSWLIAVGEIV